jgi:hypothetical protein
MPGVCNHHCCLHAWCLQLKLSYVMALMNKGSIGLSILRKLGGWPGSRRTATPSTV